MKKLASFVLGVALFATPLFAAKKATVHIPNDVVVGSTQIPAGEYKLTCQGSGPNTTVTLTNFRHSPIVLVATVVSTSDKDVSVGMETRPNGPSVLVYIDLGGTTINFDSTVPADRSPAPQQ